MNSTLHLCFLNRVLIIFLVSLVGGVIPLSNYYVYGQSQQSNDDNSFIPELPPEFDIPSEFGSLPSSPPPHDFFSDLNFSEFPDFELPPLTTTDEFESPEMNFPDVKGTYTNSDIGFQVDLPKDWKGKEIKFLMNMVFAAPQEINLEKLEEPENLIIISGIDQKIFDKLTDLTKQLPTFEAGEGGGGSWTGGVLGGEGGVLGLLQGSGQLDMSTSSSNIDACKEFQTSLVTINGISAEQALVDCIDEQGANIKAKSYVFATQDDALVIMGLVSKSTKEYNQYLPLFEESVKTIKITNPGDIATSELYKKYKELELQ